MRLPSGALAVLALQTFLTAPSVRASEPALAPAAEVKASKGSVELTLRVYKTRLRYAESIWYQVRVKNIGKRRIDVTDEAFGDPFVLNESATGSSGFPLALEMRESDGQKPLHLERPDPTVPIGSDMIDGESFPGFNLDTERKAHAEQVAAWKKQGLDDLQIAQRLLEAWSESHRGPEPPPVDDLSKRIWLEPGASTTTAAFAYWTPQARYDGKPAPKPIGEYAELSEVLMLAGKYRIRAVWWRSYGQYPSRSPLKTPWVELTVTR